MPTFREDIKIGSKVPLLKTDDINDQAITKDKIRDGNVTTEKLADGAVRSDKISDASITTPKIANGNVTEDKLDKSAVTTSKIADQSVTTEKLADQSVSNAKLSPSAVTYDKIKDSAVITEKLNDRAVTTEKIEEKAITNPKIGDSAVDSRTIREGNVQTRHLANDSVTTDKVATKAITNDKIADNTLTLDKLDEDLRDAINSATGMPDDLLRKVQDLTEDVAELKDSEFPIVLSLSTSNDADVMNTYVRYTVKVKGEDFVPDTLELRKNSSILSNTPKASDTIGTPIQANREEFMLSVTKQGRTGKSTSLVRYLCLYGGSTSTSMDGVTYQQLTKKTSANVSFNPTVKTKNGEYIWLLVPSYLTINRVTSAGFDVTLASPQTFATAIGEYKAYRTLNPLTENTWNLVIS